MPVPEASGMAAVNGIEMYYAVYGAGEPVLLIHGGLNHADIWGGQVAALMKTRQVIVADTRGHGRSTRGEAPLGYGQLAADYLALLDRLGIEKTAVVGWSDGAIIGLELAVRHPERVTRVFLDAVNATADGIDLSGLGKPTFASFEPSVVADWRRLSPTPDGWEAFSREVVEMWKREPAYSREELAGIAVPVAIVLGDHDEIIRPEHAAYLVRTIPGARGITLTDVSHFALFQDPAGYNRAVLEFLGDD
jgi:pimeloyl-ACP methyl ester carboxylesterase